MIRGVLHSGIGLNGTTGLWILGGSPMQGVSVPMGLKHLYLVCGRLSILSDNCCLLFRLSRTYPIHFELLSVCGHQNCTRTLVRFEKFHLGLFIAQQYSEVRQHRCSTGAKYVFKISISFARNHPSLSDEVGLRPFSLSYRCLNWHFFGIDPSSSMKFQSYNQEKEPRVQVD